MNKRTLVGLGLAILAVSTSAGVAAQRHHHMRPARAYAMAPARHMRPMRAYAMAPAMKPPASPPTQYGFDGYCGFPGCRGPIYQGAFAGSFGGGGPMNAIAGPYDAYDAPAPSGGFAGSAGGGAWTPGTTLNSDHEMYLRNKRDSGTE